MSFPIIILIMLIAGMAGGIINFLLPSNSGDNNEKIRNVFACLALGIGATILIPLFLEIAQSKLLDNMHYDWAWQKKECECSQSGTDSLLLKVTVQRDTSKKAITDTSKADTTQSKVKINSNGDAKLVAKDCCVPFKNYFLFAAYCFLAAAAGFRFINSIMDSVLKDKEIAGQKKIIEKTKEQLEEEKKAKETAIKAEEDANKAKEDAERKKEKLTAQARIEAVKEEEEFIRPINTNFTFKEENKPLFELGPVTNPDDPQKGRFGGKAENNGRKLNAKVEKSNTSKGNFDVTIWVESTDTARPLKDEVIIYLHDSFKPSVYTIKPEEFMDGKAIDDEIVAYGAFTVGAVADNGQTLLELDLAEQKQFPKEFRER